MKHSSTMVKAAAGLLLGSVLAQAQTYTNAFPGLSFSRPLWMEEIPTKAEHFLVLEQVGALQMVRREGTAWTKTQFVSFTVSGGKSGGDEDGLLGVAFHPGYKDNRKYYVYYVTNSGGYSEVIEERVADATLLKDSGTQPKLILRIADYAGNHNGGTIRFGKDGFLYIGTGDGGNQGDPNGNGQNKNALLAKFLRIDVDKPANGKAYGIPSDNPFANGGGAPEVYAYGFRNPYKWAFDPVTGDLYAADVGGGEMEEIDIVEKGGNYGWKVSEGTLGVTGDIKRPIHAYAHNTGSRCIIGGYVYRGNPASKYYGQYLFGDYISRRVWAVKSNGKNVAGTVTELATPSGEPRGWGTDNDGRLYLMHGTSTIYRLAGADWDVATSSFSREGTFRQAIGCIFHCKPGSRLDAKAFAAGAAVEILGLKGESHGRITAASAEVPGSLKAGMYILKSPASAKPNLLVVQ